MCKKVRGVHMIFEEDLVVDERVNLKPNRFKQFLKGKGKYAAAALALVGPSGGRSRQDLYRVYSG